MEEQKPGLRLPEGHLFTSLHIFIIQHFISSFISPRGKMKESGKRVENWEREGSAVHCLCLLEEFVSDLSFDLNLKQPGNEVDLCSENIALPSLPPLCFTHT